MTDTQNLWQSILEKLFKRIGLDNCWQWVQNHYSIKGYLADRLGEASTVEGELELFLSYRNEAAHGDVDDSIGLPDLLRYADLIYCICSAITDFAMHAVLIRKIEKHQAVVVGEIIHKFAGKIVGARMGKVKICLGDEYYAINSNSCLRVVVESLACRKTMIKDYLIIGNQNEIGIGFDQRLSLGTKLIRLSESPQSNVDTISALMLDFIKST